MPYGEEITNKLAELVALRLVNERDQVVRFLRTRTNRFVPHDIGQSELAMTLSDMVFTPSEHQKLTKIVAGDMEFLYVEPVSTTFLVVAKIVAAVFAVGASGVAIAKNVRETQEARESAISGLTLTQVEYDKAYIQNRQALSQDFFAKVIESERNIQEQKRASLASERQQKLIYFAIFIAIISAAFALIIRK